MKAKVTNTMAGKNYEKAIENAMEKTLVEAGVMIEGDAVLLANFNKGYQTGRTKGSITWATNKERSRVSGEAKSGDGVSRPSRPDTLYVGTNVEYAPHLEYGTVKMSAQPFLRPAFDGRKSDIMRMGLKEVDKGLKRGK